MLSRVKRKRTRANSCYLCGYLHAQWLGFLSRFIGHHASLVSGRILMNSLTNQPDTLLIPETLYLHALRHC